MSQPIRRLLIANRGEIACRIARTARQLGIATVAVYTDVDRDALHMQVCDEALFLGHEGHGSPYLDIATVVQAAVRAGVDAVHPGYGFLSERAEFAEAVLQAGLTWVGPPPTAMRAVGRKDAAKRLARSLGVPVVPGVEAPDGPGQLHQLAELGRNLPLPLLIKAAGGGGGRGMRVVRDAGDLLQQLELASREAKSAFGDGALLLEHFVERGRHIEVQILGDQHGHLLQLGERECSIQRRHQKILEESPSPRVDADLRARLGEAALTIGRGVGYVGAGTVEFLLDDATGAFFFLEVNARLQVEHPVTELVTGLDLVALQLAVAQGQTLPLAQADLAQAQPALRGHAIEVRLCAEDPSSDFAPQAGPVHRWRPPGGEGVRVDHGLKPNDHVPLHYDAMVAKVVAWAPNRETAIARLQRALADLQLWGVTHNRDYLQAILASAAFRRGDFDTRFVALHPPAPVPVPSDAHLLAAALVRHGPGLRRRLRSNPWRPDATLLVAAQDAAGTPAAVFLQPGASGRFTYAIDRAPDRMLARVPPLTGHLRWDASHGVATPQQGAWTIDFELEDRREYLTGLLAGDEVFVQHRDGALVHLIEQSLLPQARAVEAPPGSVVAPSAAVITQVWAQVGQGVAADDPLVAMEAMKMMTVIRAPTAGTVLGVFAQVGDAVAAGTPLVEIGEPQP
ncbi:MAG: ATP-grasp domain-containing protein [Deltaproteobacteria bacterium]|nr:ATP-grasp domain-containing protein [Deltaproteobacteria bacterium]